MKKYLVIAKNELGCEINSAIVEAEDESEAIYKYIDNIAVAPYKTDSYVAFEINHKKEIWFTELGFFNRTQINNIRNKMNGKSFFYFEVIPPNEHNKINCTLGIRVDENDYETWGEKEIKDTFIYIALTCLK